MGSLPAVSQIVPDKDISVIKHNFKQELPTEIIFSAPVVFRLHVSV